MKLVQAVSHLLHDHPIFSGLDEGTEHFIAECASLVVFHAGKYIYREEQPADRFYLIRHGRVALEVHSPGRENIIVDTLKPGDVLGWSWVVPPYRCNFDARAVDLTRLISFDAACLRGKMEGDRALGYEMYKRMLPLVAARLAAARAQLLDMYGNPEETGSHIMVLALAEHSMMPRPFVVERATQDVSDTFTLVLHPQHQAESFPFAPGQFNMLYLFGVGEVPISISGDPNHPEPLVHTIRAVGAVTSAMQRLRRGSIVGVRGPFGTAWPLSQAEGSDVLIVAGGVGLAPLRPAIFAVLAQRERYGRFVILYGARAPRDILFARQLERWRSRLDTFVDVTVDRAGSSWHGNVGVVTQLIAHGGFDPEHTVAMVCGPEVMLRYSVQSLVDRGVTHDRIYVSMERNMKCAIGFCGHCQLGGKFVCRDGPVFRFDKIADIFAIREF